MELVDEPVREHGAHEIRRKPMGGGVCAPDFVGYW